MTKTVSIAAIRKERTKFVTEDSIRGRLKNGTIVLEQAIAEAKNAGYVMLAHHLEDNLVHVLNGVKKTLAGLVTSGTYTVVEALRNAKASGITDIDAFARELHTAWLKSTGLTELELARRAAAVRASAEEPQKMAA